MKELGDILLKDSAGGYMLKDIAGEHIAFCQVRVSGFKKLFLQAFLLTRIVTSDSYE